MKLKQGVSLPTFYEQLLRQRSYFKKIQTQIVIIKKAPITLMYEKAVNGEIDTFCQFYQSICAKRHMLEL